MRIGLVSLVSLFLLNTLCSQNSDPQHSDYKTADSVAVFFPKKKYKTVTEIAGPLTYSLNTEHEKFRAIFRWITENIEYNKSAGNVTNPDLVIRKNKAVCQGFANLLKEMCDAVNIPCKVVVGYTKTDVKDIGRKLIKTDHAWNLVTLYGKNYLVDVTWATCKFDVNTRKFIREFDEHYYLTPPEKFIIDHFPLKSRQQLLDKPIKQKQFRFSPLVYPDYFHLGITALHPEKGIIHAKKGKTLRFEFSSETVLDSASVLLNNEAFNIPIKLQFNKKTNRYFFEFIPEKEGKYDYTVYFNNKCIIEYIIKVH